MPQDSIMHDASPSRGTTDVTRLREVLKYITDVGTSLRLQMDVNTLLRQVAVATCEALRFRHSVLYLLETDGLFHMQATSGVSVQEETYLRQHPLPNTIVALLMNATYRINASYFIPAESSLWQNEQFASHFLMGGEQPDTALATSPSYLSCDVWRPVDLLVVPLISADNMLLGLLTPGNPLDNLRPDAEIMACLELFANQAAIVIEGARLYESVRQSSEERAALIEIGRALFAPDALHDLYSVYKTIYEQVRRVMPTDAFIVSRYYRASDRLVMDYIVDEGIVYPPEAYVCIPTRVRKLLSKEATAFLYSTQEEYRDYVEVNYVEVVDNLFGNNRPSESLLFVPIHYGEEPLGLISVQSYEPGVYTQRHVEMLQEIGVQAGIAITNARLYTEQREAVKRAQESEQLKNHFLMTASHELRTPLTAIQGYLELLSIHDYSLSDNDKSRFITNARRASEEVILMLSNVMDTSHIDQKEIQLNLGPVQLCRAILPILDIMDPTIVREKRVVEVLVAENLSIWADESRLRQVLLNIVGNALKYTPAATRIAMSAETADWNSIHYRMTPTYRTQSAQTPQHEERFVVLAIRDWGMGIAPEDQERLFFRFVRLPNAVSSKQRGAGLGLYLCRQIIEAMNGYIWVESTGVAGEGTTFLIALPQHKE